MFKTAHERIHSRTSASLCRVLFEPLVEDDAEGLALCARDQALAQSDFRKIIRRWLTFILGR